MQKITLILICLLMTISVAIAADKRAEDEDLYLEGYIRAMLQERYNIGGDIEVRSGHVFLPQSISESPNYEQILSEIESVKGVKAARVVGADQMTKISRTWLMPGDPLFAPLIADPRWPKFAAAYRYYTNTDEDYKHTFAATIGKTFSLWRTGFGESMFTELGFQAAVFPLFDMDTHELDLINADYLVAVPVTLQFTGFSLMGRFSHMSSHLGDEYMLDHPDVERVNVCYETLDLLGSFEPNEWFRLYAGGGYIFSPDPTSYGNWQYQGGIELKVLSDYTNVPNLLIGVDAKGVEGTYYTPSVSAMIGLELFDLGKIYFELHDGYAPDGQFYEEKVTWIAFGVQLY